LDLLEEAEDLRLVEEIEHRPAEGQERIYAHEEVWSEIDDLESRVSFQINYTGEARQALKTMPGRYRHRN
jgi:hypothetical protein